MAEIASMLGKPLMPWQQHVADVALEVDPQTGRLAYREVVVTVPRQSGKSSITLSVAVHRALGFGSSQRIVYTAQTRSDARKLWEDEHLSILADSPFASLYTVRRQIGQESIRWRTPASLHSIVAPNETAAHGQTLDLGIVDEAWAVPAAIEAGLSPAMITRSQPQLWIVSTAGTTMRSEWLRSKVDAGREAPDGRTTAYFEWSADEDADPTDPGTWWGCMPALGHTVTEDAVRAEFDRLDREEFCRAYLNQWPDAMPGRDWSVISAEAWAACLDPGSQVIGRPAFAVDVTPNRQWASISCAGRRADGLQHVELVDHRPGVGWVVERVAELVQRWSPSAVVIDPGSAAGALIPAFEAAGIELVKPTARDVAAAAESFYDGTEIASIRHIGQVAFTSAVAGAAQRPLADAWTWNRRGSTVVITPLVAASLALWGHAGTPALQLFVGTA